MIAGEFDLSIGSMVGASGLVLGYLIVEQGLARSGPRSSLAFAFALTVGAINGYLVYKTGLPSFIVTLATLFILRGVSIGFTRLLTGRTGHQRLIGTGRRATPSPGSSPAILFSPERGADFKISIVWWLALALVATWVLLQDEVRELDLRRRRLIRRRPQRGRPRRAREDPALHDDGGVRRLLAMIQVFSAGSADVLRGQQKEFEAIITAVIGGTLLTGGYGSALGSMFGAFTLGSTQLGIVFAGINTDWYQAVLGVMLLVAVLVNNWTRRRASEARR